MEHIVVLSVHADDEAPGWWVEKLIKGDANKDHFHPVYGNIRTEVRTFRTVKNPTGFDGITSRLLAKLGR